MVAMDVWVSMRTNIFEDNKRRMSMDNKNLFLLAVSVEIDTK